MDVRTFTVGPVQENCHIARREGAREAVVIDPGDTESVMSRAVAAARELAQQGDTVLLAPAGASQDQFVSYAQRGDEFARVARELTS